MYVHPSLFFYLALYIATDRPIFTRLAMYMHTILTDWLLEMYVCMYVRMYVCMYGCLFPSSSFTAAAAAAA